MSCFSYLSPQQREALRASAREDAGGAPLSSFASPPADPGKIRRLRELARSGAVRIRESAALAYHCPDDVLADLAGDPAASVRCCVARNPQTPSRLLERLAGDEAGLVRGWVAAHPGASPDLLALLAGDPDPQVRSVVGWARRWEV